jgi:hypothetical protein
MVPWILVEFLRILFIGVFGVMLLANAAVWAPQLIGLMRSMANAAQYTGQLPTEEATRAGLMIIGAILAGFALVASYFFFIVVSHWNEVRAGHASDQVKPLPDDE